MKSFDYSTSFEVTQEIKSSFCENGFILVRSILSKEEVSKVLDFYENSKEIKIANQTHDAR